MDKIANYDHYKIFCKITEMGSISKAAEKLFISQPAISSVIKQLESELNTKLFFRTQRGVRLTREGEMLYSYVRQGCSIIGAGEEKMRAISNLDAGEIHIGASDMTLRFYLLPFIERFHIAYPRVKIKVTNAPTPSTLKSLGEGAIDFGVISGPVPYDEKLTLYDVREINDILIAGKTFGELRDGSYTLADLSDRPFIMLETGTSTRAHLEKYFEDCGTVIKPEIELATSDLIIEFVKRGIGIAFIMKDFAQNVLDGGGVFEVKLRQPIPPRYFHVVTQKTITLTSAAKEFLKLTSGS